jgi:hypothetical protein
VPRLEVVTVVSGLVDAPTDRGARGHWEIGGALVGRALDEEKGRP